MSFSIVKKSTRRALGTGAAIVFTGTIILGFISTYKDTKNKAVPKVNLVQAAIYAEKAAGVPMLYEAVMEPECIRLVTAAAASSSIADTSVSAAAAIPVSSVATTHVFSSSDQSIELPMMNATSPTCLTQTPPPEGYEQLGAEGFVTLALNLAETGRVERGDVEKSSGFPALDAAALKQVIETWQFKPCEKADRAVACRQYIRFRWQLE